MNDTIQDAVEAIAAAEQKAKDIVAEANSALTAAVSEVYGGKEITLVKDAVKKAENDKKGITTRALTKYEVVGVDGLYLTYKNRTGKPVSVKYNEATLA